MYYYLKLWIDICRLRIGPQDFPVSPALLSLALCAYILSNLAISLLSTTGMQALMVSVLDLTLLTFFLRVILFIKGRPARFIQTLTALLGAGALMGLLILPLMQVLIEAQVNELPPSPMVFLLWMFLVMWSLVVMGHVLRHALSVKLATGIALGVLYTLISFVVVQTLFPMAVVE